MKKYIINIIIVAVVCLLCSCDYLTNQRNEEILTSVEYFIDNKPDSAYLLLDTVNLNQLSESQYFRFIALKVRAKDKLYLNAAEDSVVFQAMRFFIDKKDVENIPISCFASARVREEQNSPEKALEYYLEASKYSEKYSTYLLNGDIFYNISRIFFYKKEYHNSLSYLKKGREYYDLANNYYKKIYAYELTAMNYMYLQEKDSALRYYNTILDISLQNNDTIYRGRTLQNLSVLFRDAKEYSIAKDKSKEAIALTNKNDTLNLGKLYMIIGSAYALDDVYGRTNKNDSAKIWLYKAEHFLNVSRDVIMTDLLYLYKLLHLVEKRSGQPERAMHYNQLYDNFLRSQKYTEEAVIAEQRKYQDHTFRLIQAERDKYAKERSYLYFALIFFSLIILLGAVFYRDKTKFRKINAMFHAFREKTDKEKAQMKLKFEETVSELKKDFSLEQLLIVFQINNTAALDEILTAKDINSNYRKAQAQVKLSIQSITWESVYTGLRNAHNGLADNLRADFPDLSEKEFRICLLSCSGFTVMGIAKILKYTPGTIQTNQTEIRKKVGIPPSGSFTVFAHDKYGTTIIN